MEKSVERCALRAPETVNSLTARQVLNRLQKIAAAEQRKREAEAEIKALRAEIVAGADAISIEEPRFVVRYTPVVSSRVDSARLKKLYPDVYADCVAPSTSYRFTYTLR